MDERESVTAVFENLETDDEVTIVTDRGRVTTEEVLNDTSPHLGGKEPDTEFIFGDPADLNILKVGFRGVELKGVQSDGSIEAAGHESPHNN
jgi:hypothetical protein